MRSSSQRHHLGWIPAAIMAVVALALGTPVVAASPATASPPSPQHGPSGSGHARSAPRPVIDANFADPDILRVGRVYHAYATNSGGKNIQHETSTDLVHWTARPDALPTLGAWTGPCSFTPGGATDHCVWAPDVSAVPGGYAMYYTARDALAPRQCIGMAFSTSPDGPFTPVGTEPLVCPDGQRGTTDLGGAIDPSTYVENGHRYLLWKADGNCCALPATIYLQPLSADGRTLTGPPTKLISNDLPFEGHVVEAPTLVKHAGTYYLFFSANDFGGGNYRTGYATATSLTGPFTQSHTELMTTDLFHGTVIGPGGQDVITAADGSTKIVFHGWDPTYSYRAMYVSGLSWSRSGVPSVDSADVRYQAEDGVVTDARVVQDVTASGEAKVGYLDNPDSSVTVRIAADHSGPATLGIRYDNGSRDASGNGVAATDKVAVNGRAAGTVTLRNTAWGNWSTTAYDVRLHRGWNTVTLTKATYYAELDAIDLYRSPVAPDRTPTAPPRGRTPTRYEAEGGVIVDARVIADPSASGGEKVGGLDNADSSVTLTVQRARAGRAILGIRFGNGSLDRSGYPVSSSDLITVDGRRAPDVIFPNTTWDNWSTVYYPVRLHRGSNTITFTKSTFYAELDAVDVY
ncbi:family 43 glycosylhydrolase [Allobranchiibius huperziae]|uniref:GH43 family beta-xylosidase n=1 Tax=Allobranchiibius huperziae TaxID=1874116 RepID=A0A853DG04_9MICO|nr:family 43 glycosylhydrolase [Allobranchiibius huperziae]NYJ74963.1 GH43 family beta-xylosidase [Allobranchiibius huperziae]